MLISERDSPRGPASRLGQELGNCGEGVRSNENSSHLVTEPWATAVEDNDMTVARRMKATMFDTTGSPFDKEVDQVDKCKETSRGLKTRFLLGSENIFCLVVGNGERGRPSQRSNRPREVKIC